MAPMSLEELTDRIRKQMSEGAGLDATVKFAFGDDGVIFVDGVSSPNRVSNEDAEAQCTILISLDDFTKLVAGELDAAGALVEGHIRIEGDLGVAMKLAQAM